MIWSRYGWFDLRGWWQVDDFGNAFLIDEWTLEAWVNECGLAPLLDGWW